MQKTETEENVLVKKTMCLTVTDEYSELQFRALKVVSAFRTMGISNWGVFFSEVLKQYPDMELYHNFKKLQAFWHLRNFNETMIKKMEWLADNLKEEA